MRMVTGGEVVPAASVADAVAGNVPGLGPAEKTASTGWTQHVGDRGPAAHAGGRRQVKGPTAPRAGAVGVAHFDAIAGHRSTSCRMTQPSSTLAAPCRRMALAWPPWGSTGHVLASRIASALVMALAVNSRVDSSHLSLAVLAALDEPATSGE